MSDKVVVITGASSGIGAAVAELLASKGGYQLVLVARRKAALGVVAAKCNGKAHIFVADVERRAEVRSVAEYGIRQFGGIDVWVNNAGRGIFRLPSELTDEDVDAMLSANVKSALYGMQEVLPHFKKRGAGHIVNVSSLLGRVPAAAFRSAYTASKHYLNALTAMMRDEVQASHPGIAFSLVSPGVVETDFGKNSLHGGPDSRSLDNRQGVGEVAAVLAGVIESRKPDVYTRRGMRERIMNYYAQNGVDPE
jgi:NAD(P)-dependent dehydrogenase (short-subunit alcohol dehydrogenase family)